MAELKHRSCPLHVKSMGTKSENLDDPVPFSMVASVFHNVDAACEIVDDKAFDDTIPYYLEKGFVTVEHEWDEPIGKPMAARATSEGLAVEGEIYPKMYEGASVAEGMRRKVYQEASIGYYVDESEPLSYEACVKYWAAKGYAPSIQDHQRAAGGVMLLKKIRLEEVAICIRGANSQARVTGVKSAFRKLFGRMFSAPEKSAAEAVKKAPEIDQKAVDELVESLVSACRAAIVAEITKQAAITANEVNPKVSQDETGAPDDAADEDADLVAVMAQLDELDTEDDDF